MYGFKKKLSYSSKSKDMKNLNNNNNNKMELGILPPPQNSSFQGKFPGVKLPNISSISLVFTINSEKNLKSKKKWEWGGKNIKGQGKTQFQSEGFFLFSFSLCHLVLLSLPED